MALKLQVFPPKLQKSPSDWGLCPQAPSAVRLRCIGFFSTGPKLDNCFGKKTFFGSSFLSAKSWLCFWLCFWLHSLMQTDSSFLSAKSWLCFWLCFWLHSLMQTDFSSDYMGRRRKELINAAGLIRLFSNMIINFLK